MSFSNILPAPGTLINAAGIADNIDGSPAPGFSGLNIRFNNTVGKFRSRSNRGLTIGESDNFWSFNISYNPMTIDQFSSLESFILGHNTSGVPFYVTLPNFATPKPQAFLDSLGGGDLSAVAGSLAGDKTITITSANTTLLPGCFINLIDSGDALHKSTYKVTRVETPALFVGSAVAAGKLRLSITPPLQRSFVGTVTAKFINPQFRVIQTSEIEVEYDRNNTVSFSMSCEEILP